MPKIFNGVEVQRLGWGVPPIDPMIVLPRVDVCLGSLSCINLCPLGKISSINGNKVLSRIWTNNGAFMFSSKMQTAVGPQILILAQTCTYTRCFGLGLFFGGIPFFQQQKRRWDSAWIEHSSVKMTSLKLSFVQTGIVFACLLCRWADSVSCHERSNQERPYTEV